MSLEPGYELKILEEKGKINSTDNPYLVATRKENKDQYMVGENLLIAPLFAGEKERTVILPEGKWYDFYTGEFVGEGEIIKTAPPHKNIPVFVKNGGIVPLWISNSWDQSTKFPLEIRHYGEKAGTLDLYDDDGETFNYEKGEYTRIRLTVSVDSSGRKSGDINIPSGKKIWSFSNFNFRFMTK